MNDTLQLKLFISFHKWRTVKFFSCLLLWNCIKRYINKCDFIWLDREVNCTISWEWHLLRNKTCQQEIQVLKYTLTQKIRTTPDSLWIANWHISVPNIMKSFNALIRHTRSNFSVSAPYHNREGERRGYATVHLWETTKTLRISSVYTLEKKSVHLFSKRWVKKKHANNYLHTTELVLSNNRSQRTQIYYVLV